MSDATSSGERAGREAKRWITFPQMDALRFLARFGETPVVAIHGNTLNSLLRRGLVRFTDTAWTEVDLTDAGRAALVDAGGSTGEEREE